jgi:hypothetical protein
MPDNYVTEDTARTSFIELGKAVALLDGMVELWDDFSQLDMKLFPDLALSEYQMELLDSMLHTLDRDMTDRI